MRVCAGGGLLVGLLIGFSAEQKTPERCTTETCFSDGLLAGLLPVMVPALVGLLLGALVGMTLALLIRLDRGSEPRVAAAAVDRRRITARYRGVCARCGGAVEPGDRIVHSRATRETWCYSCEPA